MKASIRTIAVSLLLAGLFGGTGLAASVKDGYASPTVMVPYATVKPVIDGMVSDDEWRGAASFNALQTTNHQVSPRQTRFWMTWDEDNLYVAMRSPLRKGERITRALRQQDKDVNVVFDDSYEIWIDVGSKSPDGQPVFFQFLSNFAGARLDQMEEPAVGNSRMGWTAGWQPKNRITKDNQWEMEVAIPRKSICKETPFADGTKVACLIARNFKRPWEQNSFEGTGIFNVKDTYARYILSKSASAVHLLAASNPGAETLGLSLEAFGARDETLKWSFTSDGGVTKEGTLAVRKGKLAGIPPMLDLDKPGAGSYRIRVTSADGKATLLDWCANRQFGDLSVLTQEMNDTGDRVALSLSFNPVSNYIRVTGDFIDYDDRARISRSAITVTNPSGKVITERTVAIDNLAYVSDVIKLGDIPYGDYTAKMTCYDASGKEVLSRDSKFSKKDTAQAFPWWNTTAGNAEKVLAPWTPLNYTKNAVRVWGREMKVGMAGLPAQITTQNIDLLARPAELVMQTSDGKTVKGNADDSHPVSTDDYRGVLEKTSALGDIAVKSTVTVEYDGMYKVDMTLTPTKPVSVKSLKVVVPIESSAVDFIQGAGQGIRSGFYYGFVDPKKTGLLWDSTKVDSQPMLVGSFIPYIWIGNPKAGLAWFADSDEGWVPNNSVPAIEIRRDGGNSTDVVLNLISSDFTLDKPRKITFAFQASPVKQMADGWRMDSWWCGDTFFDYQQVSKKGGSLIWTCIPFTLDTATCSKMVEERHKQTGVWGIKNNRANAVPYFENNHIAGQFAPEVGYFGDQWKSNLEGTLWFDKSLSDYMMYNLSKWVKDCDIDGYYIDNVRPVADDNIDAGRGYKLPDGRVQPAYNMFGTRTYWLRMRAAFAEQGKSGKIIIHMTNHMLLPWVAAGDFAYDGEHNVIYPEMGKDFMDMWSLERIRGDCPDQWGVGVNFMHEYQGNWDNAALKKAVRAYTGEIILNDALPSGNHNGLNPEVWAGRARFGIEAPDVRFVGYWDKDSGLATTSKDVKLAGWVRPGKVLVAAVNFGEKTDAKISLNPAKLGLPAAAKCKVWDAETEQQITAASNGDITIPVDRHDYRQIIVEAQSPAH